MKDKICKFYTLSRKCLNKNCCAEQLLSDPKICSSKLYYCMDLEQRLEKALYCLDKIRDYELQSLDIDWDEYEVGCKETEYSPIITYCEIGLGESVE